MTDSTGGGAGVSTGYENGSSDGEEDDSLFTDVDEDDYYYDAMVWAVENGITAGYSDGTFGANTICNRGAIVTFLYRYLG